MKMFQRNCRPSANRNLLLEILEEKTCLNADISFSNAGSYDAGEAAWHINSADFNGDGHLDLAVANFGSRPPAGDVSVLLGRGDGTFESEMRYQAGNKPARVYADDIDVDGDIDLIVSNTDSFDVSILRNDGNGSFTQQNRYHVVGQPSGIAIADVDTDGNKDLIVSTWDGSVRLLRGQANGTFTDAAQIATGNEPINPIVADVNQDGNADVIFAERRANRVSVVTGKGDGTFDPVQFYPVSIQNPHGITIADVAGSSHSDLIVQTSTDSAMSVLIGDGNGFFEEGSLLSVGMHQDSIAAFDADGDDDLDLAITNGGSAVVFQNRGDGHFVPTEVLATNTWVDSVNVGDFNGDNRPDLVFTEESSTSKIDHVVVLLNVTVVASISGDANSDGRVDAADLNILALNWQEAVTGGAAEGDFNGDGHVDAIDLNELALNWQSGEPVAASLGRQMRNVGVHRVPRAPLSSLVITNTNVTPSDEHMVGKFHDINLVGREPIKQGIKEDKSSRSDDTQLVPNDDFGDLHADGRWIYPMSNSEAVASNRLMRTTAASVFELTITDMLFTKLIDRFESGFPTH